MPPWRHHQTIHVRQGDRKSTRLNSSHANISYAVFCLKKKQINYIFIPILFLCTIFIFFTSLWIHSHTISYPFTTIFSPTYSSTPSTLHTHYILLVPPR